MIDCQKEKFSLSADKTYLNCAYMSPLLKSVEEAGIVGIAKKRNPFNVTADHFFEDTEALRQEYGKLINADPKHVVVTNSVSYGMANVTKNVDLKSHENVIVLGEQFPSNYYPWKRLCDETGATLKVIAAPNEFRDRGKLWNEHILEAIDKNTKVVALGHVHWADGTLFDLKAIRQRTKEVNALLIIDGTQSVGALPFDVAEIQPDALICAGYKWLLGPYAIGMSYYGEYFDQGVPVEENWINRLHSEDFAGLVSYEDNYQPGVLRYESGEHSNFILIPMFLEAIRQLNEWGVNNIQQYCKSLTDFEAFKSLNLEDANYRASHLFGIRLPNADIAAVKAKIESENFSVSIRGSAVRISPHVYNTREELERLVELLNTFS
ncbi:aminotransferase class V-fold PLP-dependent enzyme [Fulvivirga sp. RKSG066]|uniref:aminotransferase class V-fold PLP-dependent enzyme n=1 Tax=Fulvivirga aurantia TaxID=2529383 RepID=UPI0012BD63F3|nr:aminotransferase class V-fold PLP-dependent enzyme [Fulvivirga aurantia]MTI21491.1 aminotransferase class V-fold PLP-dependent enzyme [Fulvivirga aurantia]